jgi:hypothetical protein
MGQINADLNENDTDWQKRRLISKLHMNQNVKAQLCHRETKSVNIRKEVKKGCCHRFNSTYSINILPTKLLKGLKTSKQKEK